ncbi:MAG: minE [Gammaproteobacteria bacterium]|nr:minE [Gammaproteobacteria bacterium]
MSLLKLIKQKLRDSKSCNSANLAKERLQIIVAHQRNLQRPGKIDLDDLQMKLVEVISSYLHIDKGLVNVELQRDADRSLLELNVTLPEQI